MPSADGILLEQRPPQLAAARLDLHHARAVHLKLLDARLLRLLHLLRPTVRIEPLLHRRAAAAAGRLVLGTTTPTLPGRRPRAAAAARARRRRRRVAAAVEARGRVELLSLGGGELCERLWHHARSPALSVVPLCSGCALGGGGAVVRLARASALSEGSPCCQKRARSASVGKHSAR